MIEEKMIAKVFGELSKEQACSVIHDLIVNVKENCLVKDNVADICDFFSKYECGNDDIKRLLNDTLVEKLAKDINTKTGYEYYDIVYNDILIEFEKLEIPYEVADFYATKILYAIAESIKHIKPAEYDRFFNKEWKEEQDKALAEIVDRLNVLGSNFYDIQICNYIPKMN